MLRRTNARERQPVEQDSQQDSVYDAMTTAEHRTLGNVLAVIRRLEELRSRGLSSAQIAERIRLTHPHRPGGGPWSAESVERVLEIADANRKQAASPPTHVPTPKVGLSIESRPVASDLRDDQPAPLRVEPRRYHQRPTAQPNATFEQRRRRWPAVAGFLLLIGLVAAGVGLVRSGALERFTATNDQAAPDAIDSTTADDQLAGDDATGANGTVTADDATGAEAAAAAGDGDPADSLVIRIEPSVPETNAGITPASATIRTDGKLYVEGAFRSESEAQQFLETAADVFGEAALVPQYTIDPAAPDPTVSDVVLEKPVLFESGSAVIDPEFRPFLEACGDVLKLNPRIVMSVSAFTDASGSAEFNLELSQRRADAVIDFYRSLDIGDDQLISTGFGESDFVADNDTEEGRRQNRRAMLELLNVMKET